MDTAQYAIIFLILYFAGLAFVSWKSRVQEKNEGFILGNRDLGFWDLYASVISYMRAGSNLVFWFAFVALMGFGSIWILVSFFTAFIIMTLLGARAHRFSHEHNHITFPDLIEHQQGPLMSLWVSGFSFYVILILSVSQLFIAGNVLGGLLGISAVLGTVLGALIVALYIVLGGFISVVRTDVYQALVIVALSLTALVFFDWPSAPLLREEILTPDWRLVIGFGIIGFAVPASTDMWQRFFAVRDSKIIKRATFAALVTDIIVVLGLIIFIKAALGFITPGSADPFSSVFHEENSFPLQTALFGIFIVSALLSTLDNQIFNLSSIVSKNFLKIDVENDKKRFVGVLRALSVISLAMFTLMALTINDLMQWIIDTYAFVGVITPFIFYGVLARAHSDKLLALGALASCFCYWTLYSWGYYENMNWYALPYSLPLVFIVLDYVMGRVSLAKKPA